MGVPWHGCQRACHAVNLATQAVARGVSCWIQGACHTSIRRQPELHLCKKEKIGCGQCVRFFVRQLRLKSGGVAWRGTHFELLHFLFCALAKVPPAHVLEGFAGLAACQRPGGRGLRSKKPLAIAEHLF